MSKRKMSLRKKLLIAGAVVLALLVLLVGAFFGMYLTITGPRMWLWRFFPGRMASPCRMI